MDLECAERDDRGRVEGSGNEMGLLSTKSAFERESRLGEVPHLQHLPPTCCLEDASQRFRSHRSQTGPHGSGIGGVKAPAGERAAMPGQVPAPRRLSATNRRPTARGGHCGFELLAFGDELLSERVGIPGFVVGIVVARH